MDTLTDKLATTGDPGGSKSDVDSDGDDLKRAVLAGVLGAVVASVGYLIYNRLEDEHKEALRKTAMKFVEDKVGDLRAQFKL